MHAGTRHDLTLEGITVNVDNAGKHKQAGSIDGAAGGPVGPDLGDGAVGNADVEVGFLESSVQQHPPTRYAKIHVLSSRSPIRAGRQQSAPAS